VLTTIKILGLQTYGYHGMFEEERRLGQKFVFDVQAELAASPSHAADDLGTSVRYDAIVNEAVRIATARHFRTLEALGHALAVGLLRSFEPVQSLRVAVSKLSPPIPHSVREIAVEVRLTRAELQLCEAETVESRGPLEVALAD